jgi:hypothetical protein
MLVAVQAEGARARLLETIKDRRQCIDSYVREKTPASTRLSTISIVSSAVAAALTAGPAFGGSSFAKTVQAGLDLDQSESVWRLLCFGALAVSVTAAIAANLNKASDLTSRIAAAEAARATLHGLATRLEFGRLPVEDGAQEYREVLAGIPFVPDGEEGPSRRSGHRGRTSSVRGRVGLVSSLTAVALAVLLLVAMLVGYGRGVTGTAAADGETPAIPAATSSPVPAESSGAAPTSSPPPVATTGSFAGMTQDGSVAVAVSISATEIRAYLCDGKAIEAWFRGPVGASGFSLSSATEASLTGQIAADVVSLHFEGAGRAIDVTATRSAEPAGLYEAWIRENGREIHIGWAVPPDGPQLGMATEGGRRLRPAPPLDPDGSYVWEGGERVAERV